MNDRPPIADRTHIMYATSGDASLGVQAVGLALVAVSRQLDRIIELLEAQEAYHQGQADDA